MFYYSPLNILSPKLEMPKLWPGITGLCRFTQEILAKGGRGQQSGAVCTNTSVPVHAVQSRSVSEARCSIASLRP